MGGPGRWGAVAPRRDGGVDALLDEVAERREAAGWDIAICLTDLPLHVSRLPLVAHTRCAVAPVASLAARARPRTGPSGARGRARSGRGPGTAWSTTVRRPGGTGRQAGGGVAPVRRVVDQADDGEIGFVSSRITGRLRLLAGMVRANRPGRALLGLSKLLVGAFGTAAFALTTNTIWQMGDALDGPRLTLIMLLSLVGLVGWLIIAHDLWEKPSGDTPRELARLFNMGTGAHPGPRRRVSYLVLFVGTATAAALLIDSSVLSQNLVGRSARPTTRCSRGSSPRWPRWAAPSAPASRTRRTCAPPPTATTRHPPGGATTPQ